jgi:hypothetical protein
MRDSQINEGSHASGGISFCRLDISSSTVSRCEARDPSVTFTGSSSQCSSKERSKTKSTKKPRRGSHPSPSHHEGDCFCPCPCSNSEPGPCFCPCPCPQGQPPSSVQNIAPFLPTAPEQQGQQPSPPLQPTPTGHDPWRSLLMPPDQQQILPTIPEAVPGRGPTQTTPPQIVTPPTAGGTIYPAVSHYPISNPAAGCYCYSVHPHSPNADIHIPIASVESMGKIWNS